MAGQLVPEGVHEMEHLSRVLLPPVVPAVFRGVNYSFRSFDVFRSHTVKIKSRRLVTSSHSTPVHLPVEVDLLQEPVIVEEDNLLVELEHLLQPIDVAAVW